MPQTNIAFCENSQCRTLLYVLGEEEAIDPVGATNCPGCGRFGRVKDQAEKAAAVADSAQEQRKEDIVRDQADVDQYFSQDDS